MVVDESLRQLLAPCGQAVSAEVLQTLWGGYGELYRVYLDGYKAGSVIVKQIAFPPPAVNHPRGWQSDFAHQRKLRSYQVEALWYQDYASEVTANCYCPQPVTVQHSDDALSLVLEDLGVNYPFTPEAIQLPQVRLCLRWLAHFHARFLALDGKGLWPRGTYWHLDTRPDEHDAMPDSALKQQACQIDEILSDLSYPTLVHGDAKLANFCFSDRGDQVAAVDFQYVGRGCGVQDVVYFLTSCLDERQCFEHADALLDEYFATLRSVLTPRLGRDETRQLEFEWRRCYPLAWADFQRFLTGWSPGHWKLNRYMTQQTEQALMDLRRNSS